MKKYFAPLQAFAFAGIMPLIALLSFSCTQIDPMNSTDADGLAYAPQYYITASPSSSSASQSSGSNYSSSSNHQSSSSAAAGVYCLVDAGEFGKFCDSNVKVYDNCESYKSEGYSVTAVSTCEGN